MTVGELIDQLKELPPDAPLFVDGYEGGIKDLTQVNHVFVKRDVNPEPYYGDHEELHLPLAAWERKKYGEPDCEGYALR